jgi:hypothetical protein
MDRLGLRPRVSPCVPGTARMADAAPRPVEVGGTVSAMRETISCYDGFVVRDQILQIRSNHLLGRGESIHGFFVHNRASHLFIQRVVLLLFTPVDGSIPKAQAAQPRRSGQLTDIYETGLMAHLLYYTGSSQDSPSIDLSVSCLLLIGHP